MRWSGHAARKMKEIRATFVLQKLTRRNSSGDFVSNGPIIFFIKTDFRKKSKYFTGEQ